MSTMADIRLLERTLLENVTWNKARINFLAKFLVALITVKTVCLTEIASVFAGSAATDSHYKRIQRFFRCFDLSYHAIALLVVKLIAEHAPWTLTMDRTNWKLGRANINILMIGICHKGVAIPVIWTLMDKRGNSNTSQRIELIEQFISIFGVTAIACLCADREFIGKRWFFYLRRRGIRFRIRIKENTSVPNARGQQVAAKRLFRTLPVNEVLVCAQARQVWGQALYLSGMRLKSGEYLIVVSAHCAETAIADYARRWEIETLFGCFKSRGFCLEKTHLTDAERLKKLLALLALAFCWAHLVGEWVAARRALTIKKHGRKAKSMFRHGFDQLRRILCNLQSLAQQAAFRRVIQLLSCT